MNELLRQVDWRFLLRATQVPRCLDLTGGKLSAALELVTESPADGEADLVVLGFPTRRGIDTARDALSNGGELACLWRWPRPGGLRRVRARLERGGFIDVRFYRAGLEPGGQPEIWLPLDAPPVCEAMLADRPPHSPRQALLRRAWRGLGPVCALARLDGGATEKAVDELPDPGPWVLLTGGPESDAKVVALPFAASGDPPEVVIKFARTERAEAALAREAEILRGLERERPQLGGIPRLRSQGRRSGRLGTVQDALRGKPLNAGLDAASFAADAPRVTRWLLDLAGDAEPQPASSWGERLLVAPLDELEADFADRVPGDLPGRARRALAGLGDLPLICEHRDFGPWNVILGPDGDPAVIDWEDAEPRGLPGLDLINFLGSAAVAVAELPDAVAADCAEEYCAALGIAQDDFQRLRLLCWIVQSLIALRRLSRAETELPPAAADAELFLRLAEAELRALEEQP